MNNSADRNGASSSSSGATQDQERPQLQLTEAARKILKNLEIRDPGPLAMDFKNFNPENSRRERRKFQLQQQQLQRNETRQKYKKRELYDEDGHLLSNSLNLCDCLELSCPGCHYPCPKCNSKKCGVECRCNRKWVYEQIENEGGEFLIKFPGVVNIEDVATADDFGHRYPCGTKVMCGYYYEAETVSRKSHTYKAKPESKAVIPKDCPVLWF